MADLTADYPFERKMVWDETFVFYCGKYKLLHLPASCVSPSESLAFLFMSSTATDKFPKCGVNKELFVTLPPMEFVAAETATHSGSSLWLGGWMDGGSHLVERGFFGSGGSCFLCHPRLLAEIMSD